MSESTDTRNIGLASINRAPVTNMLRVGFGWFLPYST